MGLGKIKYTGLSRLDRTINLNLTKTIGRIQVIRSVLIVSAYFKQFWPSNILFRALADFCTAPFAASKGNVKSGRGP